LEGFPIFWGDTSWRFVNKNLLRAFFPRIRIRNSGAREACGLDLGTLSQDSESIGYDVLVWSQRVAENATPKYILYTLPETNSLPLNISRASKGM